MGSYKKQFKVGATVVGAVAAAVLAISTTPAAAVGDFSGLPYVTGGGVSSDDFGDEGTLSASQHANSNATCLWQSILWADGYLAKADIDGMFGPKTTSATKEWQSDYGVGVDGIVGKGTFGAADKWLVNDSGSTADGATLNLHFVGNSHNLSLIRDGYGHYQFNDASGVKRAAGYDYLTCS